MKLRIRPLAAAVHCSLLFALPGLAAAQDAPARSTPTTLDSVQVTGTRIKKAEMEGQVPVHALTREDIERSGLTSIGDVLQELTGSGSALNTRFNSSGNFGFSPNGDGVGATGAGGSAPPRTQARAGAGRRRALGQRVLRLRRGRGDRSQHHPAGDRRAHRGAGGRRLVAVRFRRHHAAWSTSSPGARSTAARSR